MEITDCTLHLKHSRKNHANMHLSFQKTITRQCKLKNPKTPVQVKESQNLMQLVKAKRRWYLSVPWKIKSVDYVNGSKVRKIHITWNLLIKKPRFTCTQECLTNNNRFHGTDNCTSCLQTHWRPHNEALLTNEHDSIPSSLRFRIQKIDVQGDWQALE